MVKLFIILFFTTIIIESSSAFAEGETLEGDDINVIQLELDNSAPPKPAILQQSPSPSQNNQPEKPLDFSSLGGLAPFKEVSVIQKKYLPKSGRFQLNGSLGLITNDPFFNTSTLALRAGYFFIESLGFELDYMNMSTTQRQVVKDLKDIQGVKTDNLTTPKSYLGGHLFYIPFYGKMAYLNKRIIPFDFYLTTGYGTTRVSSDAGDENVGTFHLGTGQIFALSKAMGLRWDLTWNNFQATGIGNSKQGFNNLFFTFGVSFFFPEAGYR